MISIKNSTSDTDKNYHIKFIESRENRNSKIKEDITKRNNYNISCIIEFLTLRRNCVRSLNTYNTSTIYIFPSWKLLTLTSTITLSSINRRTLSISRLSICMTLFRRISSFSLHQCIFQEIYLNAMT